MELGISGDKGTLIATNSMKPKILTKSEKISNSNFSQTYLRGDYPSDKKVDQTACFGNYSSH